MNIDLLTASYEPLFSTKEHQILSKYHLVVDPALSTRKEVLMTSTKLTGNT